MEVKQYFSGKHFKKVNEICSGYYKPDLTAEILRSWTEAIGLVGTKPVLREDRQRPEYQIREKIKKIHGVDSLKGFVIFVKNPKDIGKIRGKFEEIEKKFPTYYYALLECRTAELYDCTSGYYSEYSFREGNVPKLSNRDTLLGFIILNGNGINESNEKIRAPELWTPGFRSHMVRGTLDDMLIESFMDSFAYKYNNSDSIPYPLFLSPIKYNSKDCSFTFKSLPFYYIARIKYEQDDDKTKEYAINGMLASIRNRVNERVLREDHFFKSLIELPDDVQRTATVMAKSFPVHKEDMWPIGQEKVPKSNLVQGINPLGLSSLGKVIKFFEDFKK